jgi:hypothetical protein
MVQKFLGVKFLENARFKSEKMIIRMKKHVRFRTDSKMRRIELSGAGAY